MVYCYKVVLIILLEISNIRLKINCFHNKRSLYTSTNTQYKNLFNKSVCSNYMKKTKYLLI